MSSSEAAPQHLRQEPLRHRDHGLLIALASWLSTAEFDQTRWLCTDKEFSKQSSSDGLIQEGYCDTRQAVAFADGMLVP